MIRSTFILHPNHFFRFLLEEAKKNNTKTIARVCSLHPGCVPGNLYRHAWLPARLFINMVLAQISRYRWNTLQQSFNPITTINSYMALQLQTLNFFLCLLPLRRKRCSVQRWAMTSLEEHITKGWKLCGCDQTKQTVSKGNFSNKFPVLLALYKISFINSSLKIAQKFPWGTLKKLLRNRVMIARCARAIKPAFYDFLRKFCTYKQRGYSIYPTFSSVFP